ncbi:MAG: hypothetical protein JNK16_05370 [Phycisphaerales bacterium]|nr:hypothetical protein [Phycisphaerales bacterium]
MDTINTNASLRLTQAYGVSPKPQTQTKAESVAGTISRASQVSDQVAISRPEKLAQSVQRLAAGAVSQPAVEKQSTVRSPLASATTYTSRGTLAMHAQPGDRNAAATGIAIGRALDVNG